MYEALAIATVDPDALSPDYIRDTVEPVFQKILDIDTINPTGTVAKIQNRIKAYYQEYYPEMEATEAPSIANS